MFRRILLFLLINICVVLTISFFLNLFNIQPFLTHYGIDLKSLLIFCLIWGMGGSFISLLISKGIAKMAMGVKVIDEESATSEQKELLNLVRKLSQDAALPMPEVGIYNSPELNAFATGASKKRALVAVSSGLLDKMNERELEGVLAHEITHIANGDMVTMTLIQGVVNAFVMFLARIIAAALSGLGRGGNKGESSYGSYRMFVFLFEIVFMVLGSMVVAFFSRFREFRADSGGATLAGKEKMIEALCRLQNFQQIRDTQTAQPAYSALKISNTKKSGFLSLFATHPPLEERIEKLKNL